MTCISPPELNERELLAYIDGEAEWWVATHLERCPHCREKAHRLARFQDRLTAQLYRITCPSPTELGEYHLGLLSRDQAATVARHLVECPRCSREIAQLKDYLSELSPGLEFSPLEQVKVLIARLVRGGRAFGRTESPTLAPAYAGLRGEMEGPRLYQADDVQVAIEIQEDAERQGRRVLLGLLTEIDGQEFEAHLWRAGQRVATATVDSLSNFVVSNLTPGTYELILSSPTVEIHIQSLEI